MQNLLEEVGMYNVCMYVVFSASTLLVWWQEGASDPEKLAFFNYGTPKVSVLWVPGPACWSCPAVQSVRDERNKDNIQYSGWSHGCQCESFPCPGNVFLSWKRSWRTSRKKTRSCRNSWKDVICRFLFGFVRLYKNQTLVVSVMYAVVAKVFHWS